MNNKIKEYLEEFGIFFFKFIGLIGFCFFTLMFVIIPSSALYSEYLNGNLDGGVYSNHIIIITFIQGVLGLLMAIGIKKVCRHFSNEIYEVRKYRKILSSSRDGLTFTVIKKLTAMECC